MKSGVEQGLKGYVGSYRRLLPFLWPYRTRFIFGILCGVLAGLLWVPLAYSFNQVLQFAWPNASMLGAAATGSGHAEAQRQFVESLPLISSLLSWLKDFRSQLDQALAESPALRTALVFALLPVSYLAMSVTRYLSTYYMSWVGQQAIMDLRQKIFAHLQRLSLDFYNRTHVGDLISRIISDTWVAQAAITVVSAAIVQEPFTILVLGIGLFVVDWKFAAIALFVLPLCAIPIGIYGRKIRKASKLSQENSAETLTIMHENFTGIRIVKAFSMEDFEIGQFAEACKKQFGYQMRMVRSSEIVSPIIEFLGAIGIAAALYYAWRSGMSFADFSTMMLMAWSIYRPVKNLSKLHLTIQKSLAATDRVFELLDTPNTVDEKIKDVVQLGPIRQSIRFENVEFRYDHHKVLDGVNLEIPHGSLYAIVGATGSGKTTLINLIPRFYDPSRGRVLIDGTDIRNVTFNSLRGQIAIVTQETILFHDTVANNILYGAPGSSREAMIDAARRAYAHEFILQMPHGYDTIIGEKGAKLSGGQKQRLAIARAILKNPRILLLDEATSALDTESEKLVQQALEELQKGRTVIAIAHRLSTIQSADCIVVLKDGKIAEMGNHAELLARDGLYRHYHSLQFQYEEPDLVDA